jgi:hypothetical protein
VSKHRKVGRRLANPVAGPVAAEHQYLSQKFRDELGRKAYRHLINADFHRKSDGARFPKDLPESSLFRAVQYLRHRAFKIVRNEPVAEYDSRHAGTIGQYVLEAISTDQPGKLRDLATILELCSARRQPDGKHVLWVYYTATVALRFLDDGVLPSKHHVIDQTIREFALEELLLSGPRGEALANLGRVAAKLEDITKYRSPRKWSHIFRVLDLRELPA